MAAEKNQNIDAECRKILVTGNAGFIGFHLTQKLLSDGYNVVGLDNLNDYYDVSLKLDRLKKLGISEIPPNGPAKTNNLTVYPIDLKDREPLEKLFADEQPDIVINLAAQAGVRYSLENPYTYIDSNIVGFLNLLECCRHNPVKHLVYASSSSVYGSNERKPFSIHHNVDHPVSLYAATKKSNELMAHTYSHLYKIPTTGLRFFTVYGPWGRPDMAYFSFTKRILAGEPIDVFNNGDMKRDFTFVDDVVDGISKIMSKIPTGSSHWDPMNPDPAESKAPYRIFNIGNHKPVDLLYFIKVLEDNLGAKAEKRLKPMQKGDVKETYADIDALRDSIGFQPSTPIEEGLAAFVRWYLDYYEIKR